MSIENLNVKLPAYRAGLAGHVPATANFEMLIFQAKAKHFLLEFYNETWYRFRNWIGGDRAAQILMYA